MTKIKLIAGIEEAQQRKITRRLMGGETQQALADETGTSRGTIKRINAQIRPILLAEDEENVVGLRDKEILEQYNIERRNANEFHEDLKDKEILEQYNIERRNANEFHEDLKGREVVITEKGADYFLKGLEIEVKSGAIGTIVSSCGCAPAVVVEGLTNEQNNEGDGNYLNIEEDFFLIAVEKPKGVTDIPQEELETIQQDIEERVRKAYSEVPGGCHVHTYLNEEFDINLTTVPDAEGDELYPSMVKVVMQELGLKYLEPETEVQPSSFTLVPNSIINIMHNNEVYTADNTHPRFQEIVNSVVNNEFEEAINMLDVAKAITEYSEGDVTIEGEKVLYQGMEVKDGLAKRIVELMQEGNEGFKKYVAFMSKLRQNPSYRAVKELFGFIGHSDIEITDDGYIVGWKRVRSDYTDCRTGCVENYVGNTIQMPRNMVNEDSDQTCSQGLHVAAWSYLSHFHGEVILKVKVDPADVVSIPTDYQDSKLRASRYEVLGTVNWDKESIPTPEKYQGKQTLTVGEHGTILKVEEES